MGMIGLVVVGGNTDNLDKKQIKMNLNFGGDTFNAAVYFSRLTNKLFNTFYFTGLGKDHLSEMDYLRSGIGLRAMGQRDPLVEYQNEGYDLFEELINNVKFSVIRILLNFDKTLIVQKEKNIDDNSKRKGNYKR